MTPIRLCGTRVLGGLLLTLAACGVDGGGDGTPPPGALGTLAYVETECRDTKEGFVERQALRIRQGDGAPVTVFETPGVGPLAGVTGVCRYLTRTRYGELAISRQAFQAVAVSPDGTSVVFEVTDEFSVSPPLPLNLSPEQKGFFWVRADGTGLRRLGLPGRQHSFFLNSYGGVFTWPGLRFSPSGRTIAFADRGPDADGYEADQIVTIDVATGTRTQVTHLPPAHPPPPYPSDGPSIGIVPFIDERTVSFDSSANPDGLNPEGTFTRMTIKTDGTDLEVPLPSPIAVPGGVITLQFVITGDRPRATLVDVPGEPVNQSNPPRILEVFVIDEKENALQLTNFRRSDTWDPLVDLDREHIYFPAAADPLGTNPSDSCQIFSIDRTGGNLRQLTNFRESEHSLSGCFASGAVGQGCFVLLGAQDPRNRNLVFYSSCDPLGTNPNGAQIFAVQPDGSGLRQLTDSLGLMREADGTFSATLPGQWAYGPYVH
jgi:hypothetical protein